MGPITGPIPAIDAGNSILFFANSLQRGRIGEKRGTFRFHGGTGPHNGRRKWGTIKPPTFCGRYALVRWNQLA